MRTFAYASLLGLAALAPLEARQAQQPVQDPPKDAQAAPTFRSTAALIEVDVIVRDRNGKFVGGLTADDFEVFEDGKPQPVQQFYVVAGAREAAVAPMPGTDAVDVRRPNRMFVFLFDQEHLGVESLSRLKRAAEAFITNEMRGDDVAGIVVNHRMAGGRLTNSKAELIAALRTVMPYPDSRPSRMRALREFPRVEGEYEASRIAGGDERALRETTERVCTESSQLCTVEGGREVVMERIGVKARQYIDESRGAVGNVLRTLTTMSTGLARLPGRKTLVLLSEGFFAEESRPALLQIAAQAARSGVTIYALDGRGLAGSGGREMNDVTTQGRGLVTALDSAEDGPAILAGETGGFVLANASNFTGALMQIADDTSAYYVVGYAPTSARLDGKFRKIEVKTRVRDVKVRARKGYLATPLPEQAQLRGGQY
ncbi:MAG: VWA domain-containing protein [Acidobacteriota bacterium]|nr:VWA domain-containing protein [Acidobacteriota bacterium]